MGHIHYSLRCGQPFGQPGRKLDGLSMTKYHTVGRITVPTRKIAISIDEHVLEGLDHLVDEGRFQNRSRAIEHALRETVSRADRSRLVTELAKMDHDEEQELAEETIAEDKHEWPEY